MGAKVGMVAPDEKTMDYVKGREFAPEGANWDLAVAHWKGLQSDAHSTFDEERFVNVEDVRPQFTWGTSPEHVMAIDELIPDPSEQSDLEKRNGYAAALEYTGLKAGQSLQGQKIDQVFIGSCTNSRLSDLQEAAGIIQGQKVASHVDAWVVPGSHDIKVAAEAEGLDVIFKKAGFDWRNPGCSLCVGSNGELVPEGGRCVSTSNRNFVGRQGKNSRTHLASPISAAASAIRGEITDVRKMMKA